MAPEHFDLIQKGLFRTDFWTRVSRTRLFSIQNFLICWSLVLKESLKYRFRSQCPEQKSSHLNQSLKSRPGRTGVTASASDAPVSDGSGIHVPGLAV